MGYLFTLDILECEVYQVYLQRNNNQNHYSAYYRPIRSHYQDPSQLFPTDSIVLHVKEKACMVQNPDERAIRPIDEKASRS
jgi:hypothetical protein